jgi:hypothetical protein
VRNRIQTVDPIQITFATAQGALSCKANRGGWVFVADNCPNGFWFAAEYFTPSAIMTHPVLRGKNGELI